LRKRYLPFKNNQYGKKILIIGACGQIAELTHSLRKIYGADNVIASDIRKLNNDVVNSGKFEVINALDFNQIEHLVEVHKIDEIYLMAALLSATAEKTCFRLGFKYEFFISRFEFG
jgi:UDP-glucose 4-epimerase